jgi:hypothetical protein
MRSSSEAGGDELHTVRFSSTAEYTDDSERVQSRHDAIERVDDAAKTKRAVESPPRPA